MKFTQRLLAGLGAVLMILLIVPVGKAEQDEWNRNLSELPENILTAAQAAKPGLVLTGFMAENKGKWLTYEVEGKVGETCYEMEVTSEGEILEEELCDD